MIKAIIFDMDGVLVDSTKYIWKSFNILLSKFRVRIPDENIKKYLGRSLRDQIKMWKEDYDIRQDIDSNQFSKEAFKTESNLLKKELEKNVNLVNLLCSLKDNFKLAVATSSHKPRAEKILGLIGVRDKLDTITTVEEVDKHKPNPDIYLKTAKKLKVDPQECIVIEDAVNGVEAAKNANMKVIALLTKFHTKEELKEADFIIKSLQELNSKLIENI